MILKRLTTSEFIQRAKEVHKGHFDYSEVEYIRSISPVKIICPFHGAFYQKPNVHLDGSGCRECSKIRTREIRVKKPDEFIREAIGSHGKIYSYDKCDYKDSKTVVCITCKEHGDFWKKPFDHLKGQGCPVCTKERVRRMVTSNTDDFIEKAKCVHGETYDYSLVKYVTNSQAVEILCREHGLFYQNPCSHLVGSHCPECAKVNSAIGRTKNQQFFLEKCQEVHGDRYDYSDVVYTKALEKVTIICREHGSFEMGASAHYNRGSNCPKCSRVSATDKRIRKMPSTYIRLNHYCEKYETTYLYLMFIESPNERFYKIGISIDPDQRARGISKECRDYNVMVLCTVEGSSREIVDIEQSFHRASDRVFYRPRVDIGGFSECYHKSEGGRLFSALMLLSGNQNLTVELRTVI